MRIWTACVATAAVAIGAGSGASPSLAAFPGVNGKIAFSAAMASHTHKHAIFTLDPSTSALVGPLDPTGEGALLPAFSPDGTRIAFVCPDPYISTIGNEHVCVMHADGTGNIRISESGLPATSNCQPCGPDQPAFSPDGTKVLFTLDGEGGSQIGHIWIANADGTGSPTQTPGVGVDGTWSPDGTTIDYIQRTISGQQTIDQLMTMPADGSGPPSEVSQPTGSSTHSANFAPDGHRLAIETDRSTATASQVYTIDPDGSHATQLTTTNTGQIDPVFSPSGTKIAYLQQSVGAQTIWIMNADGSSPTQLTTYQVDAIDWGVAPAPAQPPVNSTAPTIASPQGATGAIWGGPGTGAPQSGQAVGCDPGTWSPAPTSYYYEWFRNGSSIAIGQVYRITDGDVGQTINCRVTAYNGGATGTPANSGVAVPIYGPPTNQSPPTISGVPQTGSTLTCNPGTWLHASQLDYEWQRGARTATSPDDQSWVSIPAQTANTYVVRSADEGGRVRCREIGIDDAGPGQPAASASLRTDAGPPDIVLIPPYANITGSQVSGTPQHCVPGSWRNHPDFRYTFSYNGQIVQGPGTSPDYTPVGTGKLTCTITGTNDVGSGTATAGPVAIYDAAPSAPAGFAVTATFQQSGDRAAGVVDCSPAAFIQDAGHYEYTWLRDGAPIGGATDRSYVTTNDDIGHALSCVVVSINPVGRSAPYESNRVQIPIPHNTGSVTIRVGGPDNQYSPTSILALNDWYLQVVDQTTSELERRAADSMRSTCQLPSDPGFGKHVGNEVNGNGAFTPTLGSGESCWVLHQHGDADLVFRAADSLHPAGVFWGGGSCPSPRIPGVDCARLSVPMPVVDPVTPPQLPADLESNLERYRPVRVIWDFNNDGHVDLSCPGDAPIARTIFSPGHYDIHVAIFVAGDPAGVAWSTTLHFNTPGASGSSNTLRPDQVFACRTSLTLPPEPQLPCITEAQIGKVNVTGNLCPVSLRGIPQSEIAALPKDIQDALQARADSGSVSAAGSFGEDVVSGSEPAGSASVADRTAAAYENATLSMAQPPVGLLQKGTALQLALRWEDPSYWNRLGSTVDVTHGLFALDQIYVIRGPWSVNGVQMDPGSQAGAALLVPRDAGAAVQGVHDMSVTSAHVTAALKTASDGLVPLGPAGALQTDFSDLPSGPPVNLLTNNFDALAQNLKNQIDLGPFKLAGEVHVDLQPDSTALMTAQAELPGLTTVPGGPAIRAGVTIRGDAEGHMQLQGIHIAVPHAYLFGIEIENLDLVYDNGGISIQGKIAVYPGGPTLDIKSFRLGPHGEFQSLDVDYEQSPGIPIADGIFLYKLGGGLSVSPTQSITGRVGLSVGPYPGGGCPVIGIDGQLTVGMSPPPWFVEATSDLSLLCLNLAEMHFKLDQTGLIDIGGSFHYDAGPFYLHAGIDGAMRLPRWQLVADGQAGVDLGPVDLSGHVKGVISSVGIAACLSIHINLVLDSFDIAGGAGAEWGGGLGLHNLRVFTGCDIGRYEPLGQISAFGHAAAAGRAFTLPRGLHAIALSFGGLGGAPSIVLRSPSGKTITVPTGTITRTTGAVGIPIAPENRTLVLLGRPEAGRWTVVAQPDSPMLTDVERAPILPRPNITAHVSGSGPTRTLTYKVDPIQGQTVQLVEQAHGGLQTVATVRRGGSGHVRFTVSEAHGTQRAIVAQVSQDGLPRANLAVAHFRAPNPKVGKPSGLSLRRRGRRIVATWRRQTFASSYRAVIQTGDGRRVSLATDHRTSVSLGGVDPKAGVVVTVGAVSASGRTGPPARATLRGSLALGVAPKKLVRIPAKKHRHHPKHKARR